MKTTHTLPAALVLAVLSLPIAARADLTSTATVASGASLNLDTGAVSTSGSGGDLLYTGTSLTYQGAAKGFNLGPLEAAGYGTLTQATVQSLAANFNTTPIPAGALIVGDALAVSTNGGHVAKLLVTASDSSSVTFQFTTYGVTSGGGNPGGPNITGVTNNYSYIPAGFPNSGISPSAIFVIFGTGMADAPVGAVTLQSSASPGLPTVLAGATISVTVGGTTVTPAMYYALPTAIAGVMPANTPIGTGTITVTYKGTASNAFSIQIVSAAMGLDTYFGTGTGLITATSPTTGALYNYTNSAQPGGTITMWGSGLGADSADSDTVFTSTPHSVGTPMTIYFGGLAGSVIYAGSSGYPGLNQINVTIPQDVATGCNISVVLVTGPSSAPVSSNFGTLAINTGGGQCSDAIYGSTGDQFGSLSGKSTVKYGDLFVGEFTSPDSNGSAQTFDIASASFSSVTGASFSASSSTLSLGGCIVNLTASGSGTGTVTGLDAGSISATGPAGTYQLMSVPTIVGTYIATLPSGALGTAGGNFTFTGTGGADVGKFTAAVVLPNPILSWTNEGNDSTVIRAQGVGISWTGGSAGSYVAISGNSTGTDGSSGTFICLAPQNALTFSVPGYVTSTLPAGTGDLSVENSGTFTTFTASGLDYGFAFSATGTTITATYQ